MTIRLSRPDAEIFVPDGSDAEAALSRTTHLCISAHQDDIEIMAAHGIGECFGRSDAFFTGLVVTDGAGGPRRGHYATLSDSEMAKLRRREQNKAAFVGEYSAQLQLGFSSASVKASSGAEHQHLLDDLAEILRVARPEVVYTHNLADKHDTHVAVLLRVIAACRRLPSELLPQKLIGCEVWRDLDWLCDDDKVRMPLDEREHLHAALLGVFDSQISGGKRYDLATAGRRRAHATYSDSHGVDQHGSVVFGMDLTPLLTASEPKALASSLIRRFEAEVLEKLTRLGGA